MPETIEGYEGGEHTNAEDICHTVTNLHPKINIKYRLNILFTYDYYRNVHKNGFGSSAPNVNSK